MSQRSPLVRPSHIKYIYDGTLVGFYCCVHESVYAHEFPAEILAQEPDACSLFPEKVIESDVEKGKKVRQSVSDKISPAAQRLLEDVFCSCLEEKEVHMLRFLIYGYEQRRDITKQMQFPCVNVLLKARRHLLFEVHQLEGFIRFADYEGMLIATITPKNFVLPYLKSHFVTRYPNENFMIIDKTHNYVLMYEKKQSMLIETEEVSLLPPTEEEVAYQELWKCFYNKIAIASRKNERCRMNHMPKRFWENMVEVADQGLQGQGTARQIQLLPPQHPGTQ